MVLAGSFLVAAWWPTGSLFAAQYHGEVSFGGLPAPGVTITAIQGKQRFVTTTDLQGLYSFPDITEGKWMLEVQMTGFATIKQDVAIGANSPPGTFELKLLTLDQMKAQMPLRVGASHGLALTATTAKPASPNSSPEINHPPKASSTASAASGKPDNGKPSENVPAQPPEESQDQRAADGLLVNGSELNGAASPFSQSFAFGNRRNGRGQYNGGIGAIYGNSALNARPYSLTGLSTPKPAFNVVTGLASFGGPLRIPYLFQRGPNIFAFYQWTRSVNDTTQSALVPTVAERSGDLSQVLDALGNPVRIYDPATGQQFANNIIPTGQISSQAQALLKLYPSPNFTGDPRYNYQTAILDSTHADALQSRFNQFINSKNQLFGGFAFQSIRTATPNVFGFLDTNNQLGINTNVNWFHRLNQRLFLDAGFQFSRLATQSKPFWDNRYDFSGEAQINGTDREPANWGPPTLTFSSGIAELTDSQFSHNRNQTNGASAQILWSRFRHNISFGGDLHRREFNYLAQQNPRGTFTFTGKATQGLASGATVGGDDFADFLLGIPDTSAIAFGNADKYFRESLCDAFVQDDWRVNPSFTANFGLRWEYGAPITELYDRLGNLDIASGFSAITPVFASALAGTHYPNSLVFADKRGFEPRIGIGWRPISGSSLLVRAGYGIYDDTSVYQTIANQMAQQAPNSTSLSLSNSACPLTLERGFNACPAITSDTFAVDPHFRIGYAQTWQASVQRDLPGSMQLLVTYLGIKGTRGMQEFLPNTFPSGAVNPCLACPVGFAYLASNGNSTRQSGQVQLRRRLHSGLTATLLYTYSKSIDDDATLGGQGAVMPTQTFGSPGGTGGGGASPAVSAAPESVGLPNLAIAQNWLNLRAERGLSTFDQRHLLNLQAQYTTGMGMAGRTLMSGWKGTFFKEWTVSTQMTVGSGLPESPIFFAAVEGTGVTGSIRPEYTGAGIFAAPAGLHLNPAAYAVPPAGQWGNAGRDTIIGPSQFTFNASLGRTFRLDSRLNLDLRFDSTNFLNHPTFTTWDTTINSAQFGLPAAANAMRSVQTTLRLRF